MAKVLFKRRTTAEIEDLEVEDGALIYNTDNGKTYMDFEEERIQTGGNADTIIARQTTEPTDEDIKLWINPDKLAETEASNVVNSMSGTETDKSPSVSAVKNYVDKNTYSTTETVIGTYNDKPLYRKIISGKLPTGSGTNNFTITNGVIRKYGGQVKSSYGSWFPLNIYYTSDTTYNISSFCNASRNNLYVVCGSQYNTNSDYEITIEYTKTTD